MDMCPTKIYKKKKKEERGPLNPVYTQPTPRLDDDLDVPPWMYIPQQTLPLMATAAYDTLPNRMHSCYAGFEWWKLRACVLKLN